MTENETNKNSNCLFIDLAIELVIDLMIIQLNKIKKNDLIFKWVNYMNMVLDLPLGDSAYLGGIKDIFSSS